MLFAGASVGGKLISFFTGNPLEKFEKFAGISEQLKTSAKAIADISIAASQFSSINSFADSIGRLADSLGKLNGQLSSMNTENLNKLQTINVGSKTQSTTQSSSEPAPTDLTAVVDKLDEIYKGLTGGEVCVYLDGSRVSGKMSSRA
jgi:regulator of replication initiation timing